MSARSPRRTFAAPFVLIAACAPAPRHEPVHGNPPPQPAQNEPPPEPVEKAPPTIIVANPPPLTPPTAPPEAAPADAREDWFVEMRDGKCRAISNPHCPPARNGVMVACNPPPPRDYKCPPGMANGDSMTIVQVDKTICEVKRDHLPSCPPKAMCNPPPPRRLDCPK